MSFLMACQASHLFKAVAPVAGTMMADLYDRCIPSNPVPILEIHGTDDDITYYDGDWSNEGGWGAYADIPSILQLWKELNSTELFEQQELDDVHENDGSTVVFERFWSENHAQEIWHYRVEGGGHDWPGSWGNRDVNATEEIWRFFEKYID